MAVSMVGHLVVQSAAPQAVELVPTKVGCSAVCLDKKWAVMTVVDSAAQMAVRSVLS